MLQRTLPGFAAATVALGLVFGQPANHAVAQGAGTSVTLEGEFEIEGHDYSSWIATGSEKER